MNTALMEAKVGGGEQRGISMNSEVGFMGLKRRKWEAPAIGQKTS